MRAHRSRSHEGQAVGGCRSKGYTTPRTPEGRSSLVPYPPWHYVGAFLVIDYWADPDGAVAFLPEGIDPHPDPGRCAFVAADWQSCSEGGDELVDPSRSQYKEVFVVVSGLLDGEEVTVCSYIWVDRDFALTRGWIQGFPKKLGSIWITRSFGLGGPADPGMEPGARFGATCAAYERRVAEATVTLEHPSAGGPVPQRAADRQRAPLPAPRQRAPRRPGRARARPRRVARPLRVRRVGGVGDARALRRPARGGRRTRPGADRPRLPLHVRLHRRRPRDGAGARQVTQGDKVALVTGGGTGIGAAIARRLAADGYAVAVTGRRPGPIQEVASEIGRARRRRRHRHRRGRCARGRGDGRPVRRARRARLQRGDRRRGVAARPRPLDVGRRASHEPHRRLPDGARGDRASDRAPGGDRDRVVRGGSPGVPRVARVLRLQGRPADADAVPGGRPRPRGRARELRRAGLGADADGRRRDVCARRAARDRTATRRTRPASSTSRCAERRRRTRWRRRSRGSSPTRPPTSTARCCRSTAATRRSTSRRSRSAGSRDEPHGRRRRRGLDRALHRRRAGRKRRDASST